MKMKDIKSKEDLFKYFERLRFKEKEYVDYINTKLGNEFRATSTSTLIHDKCGQEMLINKLYLKKLIDKNIMPSCPYCRKHKK